MMKTMLRSDRSPVLRRAGVAALGLWLGLVAACSALAQTNDLVVLYSTGFEVSEGFDPDYTLVGQGGWLGYGTGGNGMVSNAFVGEGQQAFIGYNPPEDTNDFLNVWRPATFTPASGEPARARFSVWMAIVDSSNDSYDDFRWSVYNTNEHRLFSLDFDNSTWDISYLLDDEQGEFVSTGQHFTNSVLYELTIEMDFAANRWQASLDGEPLTASLPITTQDRPLNLGDVDAVWAIRNNQAPGDNYMLFDRYRIEVSGPPAARPRLEAVGRLSGSQFLLRVLGQASQLVVLEASAALPSSHWTAIETNTIPASGEWLCLDPGAGGHPQRFYRARAAGPE